jgi:hypothetical protein
MPGWPPIDRDDLVAAASRAGFDTDFPLLVRRLIAETADGLSALDMPGGSGTAAGGFDGVVAVDRRTVEVPSGTSVWELSVTGKAQGKADEDYSKRLAAPDGMATEDVTYVQAILATWTKSRTWATARRKEKRWKDVVALNLDAVHGWLDRAPATTAWLAERLGKAMPGVRVVDQWWSDTWLPSTSPSIVAEIVLAGRQDQAARIVGLLAAGRPVVILGGDLGGDGLRAFMAAALAVADEPSGPVLRARTVHVTDPTSLAQLVRQTSPVVLVLEDPRLAAELPATHPHQLVVVAPPGGRSDVDVPPVDAQQAEALFRAAGQTWERAAELGRLARRSLPAVRRALSLNPAAHTPAWAHAPDLLRRRLLAAGAWDGDSDADREAVSRCAGRPYEEVQEAALDLAGQPDYPMLGRVGESWHLMSPEDAWLLLSPHVTKDDLAAFRDTALTVLAEPDPLAGLTPDERFQAQIDGRRPRYSAALRRGLAQTLGLLGAADRPVPDGGRAGADQAALIARELFERAAADSTYAAWASLGDVLSLLSEAAPEEFLRAMRGGLRGDDPLHARMFGDRADDGLGSAASPHTAFLWALETVAWSPDHFDDAVDVLGRLAALDPGGRLSNRPARSLAEILSSWHPETAASQEQRDRALRRLLRDEPGVARQLLLDLVPDGHGFQTAHPAPRYRPWKSERTLGEDDRLCRTVAVADLLVDDLDDDPDRHLALLGKYDDLPPEHRDKTVAALVALSGTLDDDDARGRLHDALLSLAAHHREYADTAWALPDAELAELESAAAALSPRDPVRRAARLFASDWLELGDGSRREDFAAYDAEVARVRAEAVAGVLSEQGLDAVARLAAGAKVPHAVGSALAASAPAHDADMLGWLARADDPSAAALAETAYAYVAARLHDGGAERLDAMLAQTDDPVTVALVLRAAPEPRLAWQRLPEVGADAVEQYWKRFSYFGLGDFQEVHRAAEGLAGAGRYAAALDMLALYTKRTDTPDAAELVATALEGLLAGGLSDPEMPRLAAHDYRKLFALLSRHRDAVGQQRVVNLEWQLFPLLGFDADAPALHAALSDQPSFFAELVGYVYRSDRSDGDGDGTEGDDGEGRRGSVGGSAPAEQDGQDGGEREERPPGGAPDAEQRREYAIRAHRLLRSWRRCPGAGADNRPHPSALREWTEHARARLAADGRSAPGDSEIGQALAWAAPDEDGTSPPRAVQDLLEDVRSDRLDEGLELGLLNRRGVTSRGVYDGGDQERRLAEKYRQDADAASAWPRTRRILRRLAEDYERDARREDDRAERLRRGVDE